MKLERVDAVIFDGLYRSLTLSSLLFTLDNMVQLRCNFTLGSTILSSTISVLVGARVLLYTLNSRVLHISSTTSQCTPECEWYSWYIVTTEKLANKLISLEKHMQDYKCLTVLHMCQYRIMIILLSPCSLHVHTSNMHAQYVHYLELQWLCFIFWKPALSPINQMYGTVQMYLYTRAWVILV